MSEQPILNMRPARCFSGALKLNPGKVRNKDQGRLHPADQ